jgi:hypothetical protein
MFAPNCTISVSTSVLMLKAATQTLSYVASQGITTIVAMKWATYHQPRHNTLSNNIYDWQMGQSEMNCVGESMITTWYDQNGDDVNFLY